MSKLRLLLILIVALALVALGLAAFRVGPPPSIALEPELPAVGKSTPVYVVVEEPKRGLSAWRVEVAQGDRTETVASETRVALPAWAFWGERTPRDELTVAIGRDSQDWLQEGELTVRVVADRAGSWLRGPEPATQELKLQVRLRPPQIQVLSNHTYVAQGGAEAVVYRVGPSAVRDGVRAGERWFPGFPLPGGDAQDRFALFAMPYDMDDHREVTLVAVDDVFNEARQPFIDRFFAKPVKTDRIRLSDSFLARVVPPILSQTPELQDQGDPLANYLMINGELREQNAETLRELSRRSEPAFLWTREFMQMRNAAVMSTFADRRTYVYEGQAVDQQDHLGFDLASTQRAEIQAANDGNVVLARFFGIYGNAVVIDHGYGLLTLYGHLSKIAVQEGQPVQRGDVVGRSGQTGLAGGDHLHFTTLLHGLPVNPREWWDAHWIHDRLKLKLGDALPFRQ